MHEMSIVEALLDEVNAQGRAHPGARIVAVRVRIGALRQVVPETLEFCWHAVSPDVRLEIEPVAARARCRTCRAEFAVEEDWFECPRCQLVGAELLSGKELDLMSIEMEEPQSVEAVV